MNFVFIFLTIIKRNSILNFSKAIVGVKPNFRICGLKTETLFS